GGDTDDRGEPRGGGRDKPGGQQETRPSARSRSVPPAGGPTRTGGPKRAQAKAATVRLLVRRAEGRERGIAASAFVRVAAHGERPDQVIEAGVERTRIFGWLRAATVLATTGRAH